ncbi:MAG: hypothetical protein FWD68_10545 [Alphaproteobacteria bacterium]|nr:hypothetical protein [Alphaproteobacteria bacterium]
MTTDSAEQGGPDTGFRIWPVVRQTFSVCASSAGIRLFLFTYVFFALLEVMATAAFGKGVGQAPLWISILKDLTTIAFIVFSIGVIASGADQVLEGKRFPLIRSLMRARQRFFPLSGTLVIVVVAVLAPFIAVRVQDRLSGGLFLYPWLWDAAVLPAIFIATWLGTSIAACVIERSDPIASIRRSVRLTKLAPWRVGTIALIIAFIATPGRNLILILVSYIYFPAFELLTGLLDLPSSLWWEWKLRLFTDYRMVYFLVGRIPPVLAVMLVVIVAVVVLRNLRRCARRSGDDGVMAVFE